MRHPSPQVIADHGKHVLREMRDRGQKALAMADLLASRGYPSSTLGAGSRSADRTSSTEREGIREHQPWKDTADDLRKAYRLLYVALCRCDDLIRHVMQHAPDLDEIPAGTGSCERCARFVRPTGDRPWNRIVSGLCPRCEKALQRSKAKGQSRAVFLAESYAKLAAVTGRHDAGEALRQDPTLTHASYVIDKLSTHDVDDILGNEPPDETGVCVHGHACCTKGGWHTHFKTPDECTECEEVAA